MVHQSLARVESALALSARGWPQVRIAAALGVSRQRIHKILHDRRQRPVAPGIEQDLHQHHSELRERLRRQRERCREQRRVLAGQRARWLQHRYLLAHPRAALERTAA